MCVCVTSNAQGRMAALGPVLPLLSTPAPRGRGAGFALPAAADETGSLSDIDLSPIAGQGRGSSPAGRGRGRDARTPARAAEISCINPGICLVWRGVVCWFGERVKELRLFQTRD
jgi:hypothetical protein